jgi:hypothetical protein
MRKESEKEMKKLYATLGVLMFALSIFGYVYADWTQTIYIEGEVNTGTYCVGFTDCTCVDNEPDLSVPKDIGTCTCDLTVLKDPYCEHEGDPCYAEIYITIDNAYPCYECTITIEISNCGTIPAVIDDVDVTAPTAWWIDFTWSPDPTGEQLDECESITFDLIIHILQENADTGEICPQGAFDDFTIDISTIQWNKYP